MSTDQKHCRQCGTCCQKGGPALHYEDAELLWQGKINYRDLITIREGEFAFSPVSGVVESADRELVKINGQGGEWTCLFYEKEGSTCSIYEHRPLECRLLKCWEPGKVLAVIGRDTIRRRDIVRGGEQIHDLIAHQQRECPAGAVALAVAGWRQQPDNEKCRDVLADLIRRDLSLRNYAVNDLGLPSDIELFVFGRPLFKQLAGFGVGIREDEDGIEFLWP